MGMHEFLGLRRIQQWCADIDADMNGDALQGRYLPKPPVVVIGPVAGTGCMVHVELQPSTPWLVIMVTKGESGPNLHFIARCIWVWGVGK